MYLNVKLFNAQELVVASGNPFEFPRMGMHIQHEWFGNVGLRFEWFWG
jgi:hypothetical protein